MTTSVVIFIFLIQQVWQNIDKLVGKGLDSAIILEFLFYAILTIVPQAIPLAILLASLMVFGNLGERLELLAIKASGVSLLRIMYPLIILVSGITIGSFFYQDRLVPGYNVKLTSLFISIRDKNPEVAIPEGSFYNEVPGFSIYVKKKNTQTRMLYDVVIYDLSGGFKNIAVDYCDSAIIETAVTKDYQILTLYNGERFSNVNKDQVYRDGEFSPNMRERYGKKIINIPFSTELERVNEERYDNTYISKTMEQLQKSADSLRVRLDSLNHVDRETITSIPIFKEQFGYVAPIKHSDDVPGIITDAPEKTTIPVYNFDSIMNSYSLRQQSELVTIASNQSQGSRISNLLYNHIDNPKHFLQRNIRMHEISWYRVITYSLSCLIFFFIGASLGAIIGKGGMGVPVIVCIFLFIIYYMINNVGYKLARDGNWEVWEGMWLSTGVLIPIAVFFTYKSMRESALFNIEAYNMFYRRIFKIKSDAARRETREPLYSEIPDLANLSVDLNIVNNLQAYDNKNLKDIILNARSYYNSEDLAKEYQLTALSILKERNTYLFDVRVNNYDYSYSKQILKWISDYTKTFLFPLLIVIVLLAILAIKTSASNIYAIIFSAVYFLSLSKVAIYLSDLMRSINKKDKNILVKLSSLFFSNINNIYGFLLGLVLISFWPISYFLVMKRLRRIVENIKDKPF